MVQYSANEAVCQGSDDHPENSPHALCCMWAHMQLSYNEIRLVPGTERHRSVAELAQARKGMRHRDG